MIGRIHSPGGNFLLTSEGVSPVSFLNRLANDVASENPQSLAVSATDFPSSESIP